MEPGGGIIFKHQSKVEWWRIDGGLRVLKLSLGFLIFFCGVGGTEFAVEGAVSLCSHRAEACQRQPEQLGLCQSLRSAVLSNSETGSPE